MGEKSQKSAEDPPLPSLTLVTYGKQAKLWLVSLPFLQN